CPTCFSPELQEAIRKYYADPQRFKIGESYIQHSSGLTSGYVVKLIDYLIEHSTGPLGTIHPALRPIAQRCLLLYFCVIELEFPLFEASVDGEGKDEAGSSYKNEGYRICQSWRHPAFTDNMIYVILFDCILRGLSPFCY